MKTPVCRDFGESQRSQAVKINHELFPTARLKAQVQVRGLKSPNFLTLVLKSGNGTFPARYRLNHAEASRPHDNLNSTNRAESNNLFFPYQHGLRKSHPCEAQRVGFRHCILLSIKNNLQIRAILHFAKEYDTVPHNRVLLVLTCLGLSSNIK